ncbi:MAG: ATP-binding cassette domain-containing protein [Coriobacteriales bacterium]|jgi:NitT/TauT family transport system ATP-binding protein|nr:ATP-binding cassette domain-containing protein [Coriobacteriales bacterium]
MLKFEELEFTYSGHEEPVRALHDLNLEVSKGESLVLIGPSGSGKSTLLLLAAGLLKPSFGKICVRPSVYDETTKSANAWEELTAPRLETALILQDFGLLPWKTVLENAALGLEIRHAKRSARLTTAREALARVGIADFANAFPSELSGGMRQRLALARALALDVDIMLMDEPLSAVDTMLRENLQDLLLQLWQDRGYAQILVTHSIEEAVFLGQRIAIMSARPGTIVSYVNNPLVGDINYRHNEAYFLKCREVREALSLVSSPASPSAPKSAASMLNASETVATNTIDAADATNFVTATNNAFVLDLPMDSEPKTKCHPEVKHG